MLKSVLIKELDAIEGDFEVIPLFPGYPTQTDDDGYVQNFLEGSIETVHKAKKVYDVESLAQEKIFLIPQ